jgi:hypothetical protein
VAIRCSPFHTASAFHPIIEHLKRVFGWQPEDTAPQHLAKLEAGLADFRVDDGAAATRCDPRCDAHPGDIAGFADGAARPGAAAA